MVASIEDRTGSPPDSSVTEPPHAANIVHKVDPIRAAIRRDRGERVRILEMAYASHCALFASSVGCIRGDRTT